MNDEMLPLPVAAVRLGISVATVQRLCHRGAMKFIRIGRQMKISQEELERVAREGAQYPEKPRRLGRGSK